MRLGCLFSGGKDSTYAIYESIKHGHEISCLLTLFPQSNESPLFHYPNVCITPLVAKALRLPHLASSVKGTDLQCEIDATEGLIKQARAQYHIDGIVHGGISSRFQDSNFKKCCTEYGLRVFSPLWGKPPIKFMRELISKGFKTLITSVSTMGLDRYWLGKIIDETELEQLIELSNRNHFNLNFEGGEAETLVLDSPIHYEMIDIIESEIQWDGQRGIFKITSVGLKSK
jgi:ABC transporter with metal-binding/Fe-S-binding domain ATP-binding protein